MLSKEQLLQEHKELSEALKTRKNNVALLKKQLDDNIESMLLIEGQLIQLERIINRISSDKPEVKDDNVK